MEAWLVTNLEILALVCGLLRINFLWSSGAGGHIRVAEVISRIDFYSSGSYHSGYWT